MPIATSGGASNTTSDTILDGTIANIDISDEAAIEHKKLEDIGDSDSPLISVEQTIGNTHSLTTVAGERVLVIATGQINHTGSTQTINLKYDGVTKNSQQIYDSGSFKGSCTLQYSEVPGAATKNITTEQMDSGVVITVIKFRTGE